MYSRFPGENSSLYPNIGVSYDKKSTNDKRHQTGKDETHRGFETLFGKLTVKQLARTCFITPFAGSSAAKDLSFAGFLAGPVALWMGYEMTSNFIFDFR